MSVTSFSEIFNNFLEETSNTLQTLESNVYEMKNEKNILINETVSVKISKIENENKLNKKSQPIPLKIYGNDEIENALLSVYSKHPKTTISTFRKSVRKLLPGIAAEILSNHINRLEKEEKIIFPKDLITE